MRACGAEISGAEGWAQISRRSFGRTKRLQAPQGGCQDRGGCAQCRRTHFVPGISNMQAIIEVENLVFEYPG